MSTMSFVSNLDIYEGMVSEEVMGKHNFTETDLIQCVTLSKRERIVENLVVGEEIVVDACGQLSNEVDSVSVDQTTEATMYFEQDLENKGKVIDKYKESSAPISLTEDSVIGKWHCKDVDAHLLKESEPDGCNEEQEGDEETIATFVTAAGQQLALYAVEDSDEIFAVAVYDESGEPPSSFQFLMKADVERLIGEGAVRTVKKPTQMKKRLLTTHPPMFFHKEGLVEVNEHVDDDNEIIHEASINSEKYITQEEDRETRYNNKTASGKSYSDSINSMPNNKIYTTAKQSDVTYLMMDNCPVNDAERQDIRREICEPEDELMERSTVQYILFEDDQPESELTFDEIQATLQNLKTSSTSKEASSGKLINPQDDYSNIKRDILRESPRLQLSNVDYHVSLGSQCKTTVHTSVSSETDKLDDRQYLIDALTDSPPTERETLNGSPENVQPRLRVKRSRKQQLTSVNRDDGEIIIQPASMLNEEETGKKRNKRRRRLPQTRIAVNDARRIKRAKRQEVVEVIDLDAEEEEHKTKHNIVEITLDDCKDKYSSDKENEIIMVRDSDSDDEEGKESSNLVKLGAMRCEHCSRNFRQQRAFDTHLRICQKSPANVLRLDERKIKSKEEQVRKQYTCKICQEKFDVVVALARHVRVEHSQRKKHKLGSAPQKNQDKSLRSAQQKQMEKESVDDSETARREFTMHSTVKRKRKQRSNHPWREAKKLSCTDCGRWFPSSALLDAHSLQHGTKKSEQQIRKCQICKKLIKSRLLFLRHLKMHSDAQCSTSSISSEVLRRKLRTRPGARKIMSLRKRGRPRKF